MQQKIVVLKTTVNVKIILLIEIIITIKISITKRMIAGLTEVVIKVIITVLKMTYKENSMEKKVKTHENIFNEGCKYYTEKNSKTTT